MKRRAATGGEPADDAAVGGAADEARVGGDVADRVEEEDRDVAGNGGCERSVGGGGGAEDVVVVRGERGREADEVPEEEAVEVAG